MNRKVKLIYQKPLVRFLELSSENSIATSGLDGAGLWDNIWDDGGEV